MIKGVSTVSIPINHLATAIFHANNLRNEYRNWNAGILKSVLKLGRHRVIGLMVLLTIVLLTLNSRYPIDRQFIPYVTVSIRKG